MSEVIRNSIGLALMNDAVYGGNLSATGNATGLELTTGWNVNAAYEHWNPRWRTSCTVAMLR